MTITLNVNGVDHTIDADPEMPLLWAIRDVVGLTGTKFGCGIAQCGACTVHMSGFAVRSCQLPLIAVAGQPITTIEGIDGPAANAVQSAWTEIDVPQCGYCQSGQVMAATALLARNPGPSEAEIDGAMAGNLCRCATYQRIRTAVRSAADKLEG